VRENDFILEEASSLFSGENQIICFWQISNMKGEGNMGRGGNKGE